MELRYLRYFIAVAEERSFTRAAKRLHTVQPSLSQQIRKFEDEIVEAPLFRRDKHHVELTEAGRALLVEAKSAVDAVERAVRIARQASRAEAGHLVIGFIPGAEGDILPQVLPALRAEHPGVDITLINLSTSAQLTALRDKTIDVGFLRGPVEDPDLCWEPVLRHVIVAAVPAQHDLASLDRIPLPALAAVPLVQVARAVAPTLHDLVIRIAAQNGVRFLRGPNTDGILGTLDLIGSGFGFSLLPDYVRAIKPASVEIRPLDVEPQPEIDLYVCFRKDDRNPSLVQFLSLLRERIPSMSGGMRGGSTREQSGPARASVVSTN